MLLLWKKKVAWNLADGRFWMGLDVHCSPVWEAAEKQKTEIRAPLNPSTLDKHSHLCFSPRRWRSQWCACPPLVYGASCGSSGSGRPQNCIHPLHRRGHRPPHPAWSQTEGSSRMCLQRNILNLEKNVHHSPQTQLERSHRRTSRDSRNKNFPLYTGRTANTETSWPFSSPVLVPSDSEAELTRIVPAASSGGASPPGAIKFGDTPVFDRVVLDGVRGQRTQLNARVVPQEVIVGHPVEAWKGELKLCLCDLDLHWHQHRLPTRTRRPPSWRVDSLPEPGPTQMICRNIRTVSSMSEENHIRSNCVDWIIGATIAETHKLELVGDCWMKSLILENSICIFDGNLASFWLITRWGEYVPCVQISLDPPTTRWRV